MRTARAALGALLLAVASVLLPAGFALTPEAAATVPRDARRATFGAEEISSFTSDITIDEHGALLVTETIVYDFGSVPHHGIFRDIPIRVDYPPEPHHDRVFPVTVVSVRASRGTPAQHSQEEVHSTSGPPTTYERIKIGDPDRTVTGVHTYEITYRMHGKLNAFPDHDELVWDVNGVTWPVFILATSAQVHAPAPVTAVNCASGPYGATLPCAASGFDGATATFAAARLGPFSNMTIIVALPKGAILPRPRPILEERFDLASAFRVTTGTVAMGIALLVFLVGAAVGLVWVLGRDRRARGSAVDAAFATGDVPDERVPLVRHDETPVEFAPPDGLRPGQIGTLVDFQANPLDVTATIVDLAVRGFLTIADAEPGAHRDGQDWTLARTAKPAAELLAYEQLLLDGLFRDGDTVTISELRYKFAARMGKVRAALTEDATDRGWFAKGNSWRRLGVGCLGIVVIVIGVALAIALAAATHAALVAIPVVVAGAVLVFGTRFVPRRTAQGYAVLRHVDGFRRFIDESEKERARFAERANLFSEYLPYAIVFGATEKWAKAFAGLDGQLPDTSSWYPHTGAFDALVFSSAIDGFTVTTAGTLTAVPVSTSSSSGFSGFSGGGFSGGGGGGGGGSW
jgi:uncharacterized protein (TIGR04222 family)